MGIQNSYIKQAINGTFIEEKNRSLTIKTCYGVLDKDIELSYLSENVERFVSEIDELILEDVTGDNYSYGIVITNDLDTAINIRRVTSLGYAGVGAQKGKITKKDIQRLWMFIWGHSRDSRNPQPHRSH